MRRVLAAEQRVVLGHLGLDGVGDTKSLLESEMRAKHIKWMTSTRMKRVEDGHMIVEEIAEDGSVKAEKDLPFAFSMMLPAFRGIEAVRGVDAGLHRGGGKGEDVRVRIGRRAGHVARVREQVRRAPQ